jgi:hypothetical protein
MSKYRVEAKWLQAREAGVFGDWAAGGGADIAGKEFVYGNIRRLVTL